MMGALWNGSGFLRNILTEIRKVWKWIMRKIKLKTTFCACKLCLSQIVCRVNPGASALGMLSTRAHHCENTSAWNATSQRHSALRVKTHFALPKNLEAQTWLAAAGLPCQPPARRTGGRRSGTSCCPRGRCPSGLCTWPQDPRPKMTLGWWETSS